MNLKYKLFHNNRVTYAPRKKNSASSMNRFQIGVTNTGMFVEVTYVHIEVKYIYLHHSPR